MKYYTRQAVALAAAILMVPSASALTYDFPGVSPPEQYHPQIGAQVISEGYEIPSANKARTLPANLPDISAGMMYDQIGVSVAAPQTVSVAGASGGTSYPTVWQGALSGGVSSGGTVTVGGVTSVPLTSNCLGSLSIASAGFSCKVYEGESTESMEKGAGHISSTSMWDGNVALCGHNRGSHAHFAKLKNVSVGDVVTYTTALGTRSYRVISTDKISADDLSVLHNTSRNTLTLLTCIANTPNKRLCVTAVEIS